MCGGIGPCTFIQDINDLYDLFTTSKKESFKSEISVAIVSRRTESYKTTKGFYILEK